MTDIVERLRKPSGIGEPMDHMVMEEAANLITRLRAPITEEQVERAAKAIFDNDPGYDCGEWENQREGEFARDCCMQQARAALTAARRI